MAKLIRIRLWLFLCLLLTGCGSDLELNEKDVFYDIDGTRFEFDIKAGKYLIINYWAEWCKPCIKEIPELNLLAAKNPDRWVVIGVNFDELPLAELTSQVNKLGIEYPVLTLDPASYLQLERPEVLPTTYLLDADLSLIKVLVGAQSGSSIMQAVGVQ